MEYKFTKSELLKYRDQELELALRMKTQEMQNACFKKAEWYETLLSNRHYKD